MKFIAFDWCGWNEQYGRFTFCDFDSHDSGDTLVCRPGMDQRAWDQAQLEWFRKYPGLTVYRCPESYHPNNDVMGTTEEIIQRLESRLAA